MGLFNEILFVLCVPNVLRSYMSYDCSTWSTVHIHRNLKEIYSNRMALLLLLLLYVVYLSIKSMS